MNSVSPSFKDIELSLIGIKNHIESDGGILEIVRVRGKTITLRVESSPSHCIDCPNIGAWCNPCMLNKPALQKGIEDHLKEIYPTAKVVLR